MTITETWLQDRAAELKASIDFCTRLPLAGAAPIAGGTIAKAAWAFPVAGLIVGLIGAVVYALAHRLGLPAWPAAALTVAATLLATGCLHEDGLADTADGFGGGKTDALFLRRVQRRGSGCQQLLGKNGFAFVEEMTGRRHGIHSHRCWTIRRLVWDPV